MSSEITVFKNFAHESWLQAGNCGKFERADWICLTKGYERFDNDQDARKSWLGYIEDDDPYYAGHYPKKWSVEPSRWPKKPSFMPSLKAPEGWTLDGNGKKVREKETQLLEDCKLPHHLQTRLTRSILVRLWKSCTRQSEWGKTDTSGEYPLPPCFLVYSDKGMRNCELEIVVNCSTKAMLGMVK